MDGDISQFVKAKSPPFSPPPFSISNHKIYIFQATISNRPLNLISPVLIARRAFITYYVHNGAKGSYSKNK